MVFGLRVDKPCPLQFSVRGFLLFSVALCDSLCNSVGMKIKPTESHGGAQRATEVIQWFSIALTAAFVPYHKLPVMRTLQLLAFVSLFFNLTANSQIPKGSLFFGGDVAFSFEKGSSNTM
jgi:hypothetical protein